VPKKVLAWHHHRRGVDDGNQRWELSPAGPREPKIVYHRFDKFKKNK